MWRLNNREKNHSLISRCEVGSLRKLDSHGLTQIERSLMYRVNADLHTEYIWYTWSLLFYQTNGTIIYWITDIIYRIFGAINTESLVSYLCKYCIVNIESLNLILKSDLRIIISIVCYEYINMVSRGLRFA